MLLTDQKLTDGCVNVHKLLLFNKRWIHHCSSLFIELIEALRSEPSTRRFESHAYQRVAVQRHRATETDFFQRQSASVVPESAKLKMTGLRIVTKYMEA
jgi:hypothetical protein